MNPYENLIQLEVYFEELNYERILETPTYDVSITVVSFLFYSE